jgi:N-acetylneuraminate synthase
MSIFIIAEIGINHNGDVKIVKKLIDGAIFAGADAVKFQKRTVEKVYSKEELDKPRESPWGITNRDQKMGLELGEKEYDEINRYCTEKGIFWFASAWDIDSQRFLQKYKCKYNKIASAMLTNKELLEEVAKEKKYTFIGTGMSTMEEIEKAISIFEKYNCPYELMHCNSVYPMPEDQANLKVIPALREKFNCKVGLIVTCGAVVLGATSVERHITLDRAMYGSDQAASIEIMGFYRVVSYVRTLEKALGNGIKVVTNEEESIKKKLRKINTL